MRSKKGFTLLEIIISVTGFFLLMTLVINSYISIVIYRSSFQARSKLLETTYYMFEKVNLLLRDYTIDYEEYFNRAHVGCDNSSSFSWDVGDNGYCDLFTAFGNNNSFENLTGKHSVYYCSSFTGNGIDANVFGPNPDLSTGCAQGTFQSFGEYSRQFIDVKNNVDFDSSVIGDSDDSDLGKGPDAIQDSTSVKELYLISKDKQYRVFIRRALVESGDWNSNGIIEENENLYTLQILKLRSFDAGSNHDFNINNSSGVYDSVIDTWTCDYSQGFVCDGNTMGNIYSGYHYPLDSIQANSGRVNLFDNSVTVTDRNISVYPTKDPNYAWSEKEYQISPYFTISVKTKLYAGVWQKKIRGALDDYQFTLQTTFTTKNNY